MARAQRVLACAIGFVPVSVAGIMLMTCGCAVAAYRIEVATAISYIVFILAAPR